MGECSSDERGKGEVTGEEVRGKGKGVGGREGGARDGDGIGEGKEQFGLGLVLRRAARSMQSAVCLSVCLPVL